MNKKTTLKRHNASMVILFNRIPNGCTEIVNFKSTMSRMVVARVVVEKEMTPHPYSDLSPPMGVGVLFNGNALKGFFQPYMDGGPISVISLAELDGRVMRNSDEFFNPQRMHETWIMGDEEDWFTFSPLDAKDMTIGITENVVSLYIGRSREERYSWQVDSFYMISRCHSDNEARTVFFMSWSNMCPDCEHVDQEATAMEYDVDGRLVWTHSPGGHGNCSVKRQVHLRYEI